MKPPDSLGAGGRSAAPAQAELKRGRVLVLPDRCLVNGLPALRLDPVAQRVALGLYGDMSARDPISASVEMLWERGPMCEHDPVWEKGDHSSTGRMMTWRSYQESVRLMFAATQPNPILRKKACQFGGARKPIAPLEVAQTGTTCPRSPAEFAFNWSSWAAAR
jgi:hypothetical protein